MKPVYKCDFCYHFGDDAMEVQEHEVKCITNPARKSCLSCKHAEPDAYEFKNSCTKGLDVLDAIEDGGCEGWELEDN